MSRLMALLLVLLTWPFFVSCSVHPLPEDVTRDTTLDIVKKIRCEAAEALNEIAADLFAEAGYPHFAAQIRSRDREVEDIFKEHHRELSLWLKTVFYNFSNTGVGFDFTFDITSASNNESALNFRLPFMNPSFGTFTLGLEASKNLRRRNQRKFVVETSFIQLHNRRYHVNEFGERIDCHSIAATMPDAIYPITGEIGLQELFDTYIRLAQQSGLDITKASVHDFTDTLTFSTTLSASAKPGITLSPVTDHVLRVASASSTVSGTRTDIHSVRVALEKGKPFPIEDLLALDYGDATAVSRFTESQRAAVRQSLAKRRVEDVFILENRGLPGVIP